VSGTREDAIVSECEARGVAVHAVGARGYSSRITMRARGAPAGFWEKRIHLTGTALNTPGFVLDPSGTAIHSSGTAVDVRSMASELVGATFSSSESDEGLNGTALHSSGTVIGSR